MREVLSILNACVSSGLYLIGLSFFLTSLNVSLFDFPFLLCSFGGFLA